MQYWDVTSDRGDPTFGTGVKLAGETYRGTAGKRKSRSMSRVTTPSRCSLNTTWH